MSYPGAIASKARRAPHYGPVYGHSLSTRQQGLVGNASPRTRQQMRRGAGRYLSGLGGESPDGSIGIDPAYQGREVYEMEQQDDTFGSGIFDPGGRSGTANADAGVFASHNSLPGYLAREVPFAVSRDVTDITDGADVVTVPAGGLFYVEQNGRPDGYPVLGPTYRPPQIAPGGAPGGRQSVYKHLTRPGQRPAPPLNPHAPVVAPPTMHPARNPTTWSREVGINQNQCGVPTRPATHLVPSQMNVEPFYRPAPIAGGGCPSLGEDAPTSSLAAYVAVGVAVGAATAWWTGRRRRR